ncbi:unnamed protein product [Paramecium sonneborni]|uniref:Transmembrane protein n=1 Tax=Paramecium sonneborni TaxID=65129 RepID=A0A8S1P060_9CILI|nr:unnamed protein product [Paramecium sonneborni]
MFQRIIREKQFCIKVNYNRTKKELYFDMKQLYEMMQSISKEGQFPQKPPSSKQNYLQSFIQVCLIVLQIMIKIIWIVCINYSHKNVWIQINQQKQKKLSKVTIYIGLM